MKWSKIVSLALASTLLLNVSCRKDEPDLPEPETKETSILIANEGNFGKKNASVTKVSQDFSSVTNDYYALQNGGEPVGEILQDIGLSGTKAYLVVNNSNKIEVVDRTSFKKIATVSSNLSNPRYIAFSGNSYYVTNNNFFDVRKVNIYSTADNTFQKSITFPNYAEKISEAAGFIYVQTDGVTYDANYNELPTGHTITRLNPATNSVDKTITLTDTAVIRDMISANGTVYVLSSDEKNSYLYKIAGSSGDVQQVALSGLGKVVRLAADKGQLYLLSNAKKVYSMPANATAAPTTSFPVTADYIYGFNVIDGNVMISDSDFMSNSTVRVYNTTGTLIKTFSAGMGANGFFKN